MCRRGAPRQEQPQCKHPGVGGVVKMPNDQSEGGVGKWFVHCWTLAPTWSDKGTSEGFVAKK